MQTFEEPAYLQRQPLTMHRTANLYRRSAGESAARQPRISHSYSSTSAGYNSAVAFNRRPMLSLLIAAHNEELVLENTIRSAMRAGMPREHIYVVDDNSTDKTSQIARDILGRSNVIKVGRSGKGLALTKANKHFQLTRRYRWIHVADADGGFSPDYFKVFRKRLRVKYAAATGFVRSLPGGPISQFRVVEYTVGQEIHRRFQSWIHTINVIPGPTSCFRSDIFRQVNFANKSMTEDFDVTLQIHRMGLGKIQFIPEAIAYTQDPKSLSDFIKQINRWNRGMVQGIQRHKIGRKLTRLDAYMTYHIVQNFLFFASYFLLVPYLAFTRDSGPGQVLAFTFLYDVVITAVVTLAVAVRTKRFDILSAFPHIYIYRYVTLLSFIRSFVEVAVLRRYKETNGVWSTAGRRYKPTAAA